MHGTILEKEILILENLFKIAEDRNTIGNAQITRHDSRTFKVSFYSRPQHHPGTVSSSGIVYTILYNNVSNQYVLTAALENSYSYSSKDATVSICADIKSAHKYILLDATFKIVVGIAKEFLKKERGNALDSLYEQQTKITRTSTSSYWIPTSPYPDPFSNIQLNKKLGRII